MLAGLNPPSLYSRKRPRGTFAHSARCHLGGGLERELKGFEETRERLPSNAHPLELTLKLKGQMSARLLARVPQFAVCIHCK